MDVNLLCNFMESLCGTLVLCRNYQNGNKHTLHGVTLPRNWLLTLMPTIADMQWKDTRYLREFSEAMVSMLDHIIFAGQRSRFIFEGRDFSNCGGQVKNAFIARICMCLLGYNVRDDKLRDQILRDIVSRKPNYVLPALCARYFEATTWEGLTRVLRGAFSTTREGIRLPDRLVQLHDVRHPAPSRSVLQNVQKLVYKNVDDICNLLLVTSGSSEPALLRPNAESFTPRASVPGIREGISEGPAAPADDAEEDLQDIPEEVAPDIVEEGLEANEDIGGEYTWANTITPERIRAVTIIQTAYRNVRRRQRMLDACLSTRTGRLWRACSDIAQSTDSMEKRYRSLFLGPFVHALLCLEVLYSYASLGKDGAKKRFKKAQHQELEETSEQMTHFRNLLRQVIDLQKELQPKSDFHRQSNASSLVARMSDIQRLVHEIRDQRQPLGVVENCDKRLDRALEREERRKQQPKREPLPQLVLDDESDLFNDVW
ncbi:hypothetical protein GLOTRDRAFT_138299 [Gloeophyllum trabeum ATCC 11539]|uniref:Uncharacterized protein n=1 Tax=Gloeophyllum trabeum (strain ATCC 11539 / FP-39264 / Madison 617) TaxID=670483 RepID=S7RTY5_GLOTA|nr:uncharacterized protein GLOTRDRAFT_138299 [Gloeophyllum trabeum ATCC 11539]EPQ56619.1 hypothetical protein GLOTRDRAFT_138299 [Gloeophyllum trabeum ATCC 11539]